MRTTYGEQTNVFAFHHTPFGFQFLAEVVCNNKGYLCIVLCKFGFQCCNGIAVVVVDVEFQLSHFSIFRVAERVDVHYKLIAHLQAFKLRCRHF